jgi:hypothetical protein
MRRCANDNPATTGRPGFNGLNLIACERKAMSDVCTSLRWLVTWGSHHPLSASAAVTESRSAMVIVMVHIAIRLRAYRSRAHRHHYGGDQGQCRGTFHYMLLCA